MFGVRRCSRCGSMQTGDDLTCVGCGKQLRKGISEPLLCEECGQVRGTNLKCERCTPMRAALETPPAPPDESTDEAPGPDAAPERPSAPPPKMPAWRPPAALWATMAVLLLIGVGWFLHDRAERERHVREVAQQMAAAEEARGIVPPPADSATPAKAAKSAVAEYPGPGGVLWGISSDDAATALSTKFTLVSRSPPEEGASTAQQHYSGHFGGFATDDITVEFCRDSMSSVVVRLRSDPRPLYRRWQDVFDAVKQEYGEPTELVRPPAAEALDGKPAQVAEKHPAGNQPAEPEWVTEVEDSVLDGSAVLGASWRLAHGVSMHLVSQVDSSIPRKPRTYLTWTIVKGDLASRCREEQKSADHSRSRRRPKTPEPG
jgi:hypothetical protein